MPFKVVPQAYEMNRATYGDLITLKNGFKLMMSAGAAARPAQGGLARR